jgi:ATP-dependent helicase HrpA
MFNKESLTIKDAFFLENIKKREQKISDQQKKKFELSQEIVTNREKQRPSKISFPETLPITNVKDEIIKKIKDNQVIILCGETGSGKTTQLPKFLYSLGYGIRGRIGCTQPRRIATVSMAKRVCDEMYGCNLGEQVGYKVRFDEKICAETSIKFMTDGILLAETTSDRNLLEYDAIIIDEAHERSLNIDFILGYIKRLLKKRPDLKIIISSATLDAEKFAAFFDDAPVINVKGRHFPVEVFHLPELSDSEELNRHILRAVKMLNEIDNEGDILVFLPGEREIRDAADLLKGQKWKATEVLPLYGRLTLAEQQRIFTVGKYRRIILSTNVAETSLTIPGINFVIDSGLVRMKRYSPRTQIESLQIEQISKAAAKQRQGRCGRIAEGICIRLYDEMVYEDSEEFTAPEILRTSLADVILHMKMIKLPDIEIFPFVDAPKRNQVREGIKTLYEIGALDKNNELTNLGRKIGSFSVDPRLARMLVEADKLNIFTEVSWLVAVLSIRDPRDFPIEKQDEIKVVHRQWTDDRSDFLFFLHLRNTLAEMKRQKASNSAIRRFCKKNFLNYMRVREWENLQNDLKSTAREMKWKNINTPLDISKMHYDHLHRSIICGVPMQIGRRNETKSYSGTANKEFFIFPGSALFDKIPEWVITFNLVETTKLYARTVAQINPELIEQAVPYLCKTIYSNPSWDSERGFVCAEKNSSLGGLAVTQKERAHYGTVNPEESRKIFITEGLIPANITLKGKWIKEYRQVLQKIQKKEIKIRRPGSGVDFHKAYQLFDNKIPQNINNAKDLDRWTYKNRDALQINEDDISTSVIQNVTQDSFPDTLCKGDDRFKIEYQYNPGQDDDGATVYVPANRLFMITPIDLEWLVKGWVEQKTLLVLKTLLKPIRMQLNPLSMRAKEFAEDILQSSEHLNKPFMETLVSYIRNEFDIFIGKDDMNIQNLPIWFVPRIAVLNSKNQIISTSRNIETIEKTIPDKELLKTKKKKLLNGFPEEPILPKETLNGKTVYNALKTEKHGYRIEHFVDQEEADAIFYKTIASMFREQYPTQVQFLEKKLPLDIHTRLTLGAMDSQHLEDFIDASIYLAFNKAGDFPYSRKQFEISAESARSELYECGQELAQKLSAISSTHSEVMDALDSVKNNTELTQDIELQLAEIFYNGFLLKTENLSDIPRWLKGIQLRIERASFDPQKDLQKYNNIKQYVTRIHTLLQKEKNQVTTKTANILFMLQEFRISTFAPEVGRRVKVSEKKLRTYLS